MQLLLTFDLKLFSKLSESDRNSYGFPFVVFVSMQLLLTFDLKLFVRMSKILTSHTANIFSMLFRRAH